MDPEAAINAALFEWLLSISPGFRQRFWPFVINLPQERKEHLRDALTALQPQFYKPLGVLTMLHHFA
jgi:hypothetical protein